MSSSPFKLIQLRKITTKGAEVPVGILSERQGVCTVMFDAEAAATQEAKSLKSSDYAVVQPLIDRGTETALAGGGLGYAGEVGIATWRLVLERREGRIRLLSLDQVE